MFAPISQFEAERRVPPPLSPSLGTVDLEFHDDAGISRVHRMYQSGMMRVRFPNVKGAPEAVLINTAGGLTGGDCVTIGVEMSAGTAAIVTTQAHEKVYKSSGGTVSMIAGLKLGQASSLEWLPQPTILFDRAMLARETHVELAGDADFLGVEAVIFGRTAMGETMNSGALSDHWTIRRDGRLIHADRFALEGAVAASLSKMSVLAGSAAMATIRHVASGAAVKLEAVREALAEDGAASAWNGMLLARIVTKDGYGLSAALARVLTALRGKTLPPVWNI
jgi:urease accessory protein